MIHRFRNYVILLLATIAVWFLQPGVDAFLQQNGWDRALDRAIEWWTAAPAYRLPQVSQFWAGAFAVLAISGALEIYYVLRRRRARSFSPIQAALPPEGLNYAYVHFLPETGEIVDSYNINSVGRDGSGDFRFTLAEMLDARTLSIHPLAGSPMPSEWSVSSAGDSIEVKYKSEPEAIRLRFDSFA
jgi:hypothetical protein